MEDETSLKKMSKKIKSMDIILTTLAQDPWEKYFKPALKDTKPVLFK